MSQANTAFLDSNTALMIGTYSPSQLMFGTNNTERMRIDSTGNVGIGTNSPSAKLDISGNIKIADGTQGAGKVLTSDSNGLATWQTATSVGSGIASTVSASGVIGTS